MNEYATRHERTFEDASESRENEHNGFWKNARHSMMLSYLREQWQKAGPGKLPPMITRTT